MGYIFFFPYFFLHVGIELNSHSLPPNHLPLGPGLKGYCPCVPKGIHMDIDLILIISKFFFFFFFFVVGYVVVFLFFGWERFAILPAGGHNCVMTKGNLLIFLKKYQELGKGL